MLVAEALVAPVDEDKAMQEIITPYVILNKTDLMIQVYRLQKRKKTGLE